MNAPQQKHPSDKPSDQSKNQPMKDNAGSPMTLTEKEMGQMLDNFKQMVKTGVIDKTPFEIDEE